MINVIAGAVARPRITHAKRFFEWNWIPHQISAFGGGPGPAERRRETFFRNENRIRRGLQRIGGSCFLDDVFRSVNDVAPRTAMPMIVTRKIKNAVAGDIERNVVVRGKLIKVMAGVRAAIAAGAVVCAAHVSARADALPRPLVPLSISIQANGNRWRFGGDCGEAKKEAEETF